MNRPTIGFVIPNLTSGGAQRVVSTLANKLVNEFNIVIISFRNEEPFYTLDSRIKHEFCIETIRPSTNIFQAFRTNLRLLKGIRKHCSHHNIELLISFLTSANILSVIVARLLNISSIICERNNPSLEPLSKTWEFLRRRTYKTADQVVVQTPEIADYYRSWIAENSMQILPNPISPELSAQRNSEVTKEKFILNVGRLSPQKGQDMLIRAFADSKHDGWKLIILGEGELRDSFEMLIEDLGLQGKVVLPGRQKEVYKYYNKASIFAFSSNYEGFPNALIEAMHFGMACISTDCPTGPSDLIKDGVNGYLVAKGNIDDFTMKLNTLMMDRELRFKFSREAPKAVIKYEIDGVLSQWRKLIKDII